MNSSPWYHYSPGADSSRDQYLQDDDYLRRLQNLRNYAYCYYSLNPSNSYSWDHPPPLLLLLRHQQQHQVLLPHHLPVIAAAASYGGYLYYNNAEAPSLPSFQSCSSSTAHKSFLTPWGFDLQQNNSDHAPYDHQGHQCCSGSDSGSGCGRAQIDFDTGSFFSYDVSDKEAFVKSFSGVSGKAMKSRRNSQHPLD